MIVPHAPVTEVSIALLCQELFEKCLCNQVATLKNTDNFCYTKEAITCNHQINAFHCTQMNETQRKTLVCPLRMHWMYCSMPKDTSWAEVTLNSKNFKPVALAIIQLHLSEGIRQLVSQSVSQSASQSVENSVK